MTDENLTIAELEQQYEHLQRKARRKPKWRRARNNAAERLVEAKRDRVADLEQKLPDDDRSPASVVATNLLQDDRERTDVAELREERDRHREDIAELEAQQ